MLFARRRFLHFTAGAASLATLPRASAAAQNYPARPVRIVVPYPPGIAPDIATRLLADPLSQHFGQQFGVDNRPGGASNVGAEMVVRAPADGYTLLTLTVTNTINVSLYEHLPFDVMRDIAPVAGLIKLPLVLVVNPAVPAKTLPEFIAYAKANPGKINYASIGSGAATNVAGELFKMLAKVDLVNVPYRNSYIPDLLSGQVQAGFTPIMQTLSYIKAGKLRALAVTGVPHSDVLPDVPNAAQVVPGFDVAVWDALGAPAATPPDIIAALNSAINAALRDPKLQARFTDLGAAPMIMTPAELKAYMALEVKKWGEVVRAANIRPE